VLGRGRLRDGDGDVLIEVFVDRIIDELSRVGVLDVRGLKADRQAERPVDGAAAKKLDRLIAHDRRQVPIVAVFVLLLVDRLARDAPPEVERVFVEVSVGPDAVLAD